jgi:hypothetical protein
MRRLLWLNATLLAAVAALALLAYFKPAGPAREYALSALAPSQVKTIRIERPGMEPIRIEKRGEDWFVSAPFAARAEAFAVQRLLEIAQAKSAHRLEAARLERFGLDPPEARLVLDGERFDFGLVNPLSHEQYVLAAGAVYTVSPRYGTALPASAAELASRRLFAASEALVRIELRDFVVEKYAGRWRLAGASGGESSQDDLIRWVEDWRGALALRVTPFSGGRAQERVGIVLEDGRRFALSILAREPELVLVRPDENLQYHFFAGRAQRLLAPPGSEPREKP